MAHPFQRALVVADVRLLQAGQDERGGQGESLTQFPIAPEDCILADGEYATAKGIHYGVEAGGQMTVRVNSGALAPAREDGEPLDLGESAKSLQTPGIIRAMPA